MRFPQFCCASSRASKQAEAEAETRRARIVPILDASANTHHQHRRHSSYSNIELPPPRYEDLTSSVSLHAVPVVLVDEKHEHNTLRVVKVDSSHNASDGEDTRHAMLLARTHATEDDASTSDGVQGEGEGSDRSSVLSIPSTQVTGLGSSYTGTTTLRGDETTGRMSGDDGSRSGGFSETGTLNEEEAWPRPPSYYDASSLQRRRSPSPGSESEGGNSVWIHPVMRQGWFERLSGSGGEGGAWRR